MEKLPVDGNGGFNKNSQNGHHLDNLDEDIFLGDCGEAVPIKGINKHFTSGPQMKKKYNDLFMNIDKLVSKQANSLQDWKNVKVMFSFLEGHMKMMINKESKKQTHFGQKNDVSNANRHNAVQDDEEEEEIVSLRK